MCVVGVEGYFDYDFFSLSKENIYTVIDIGLFVCECVCMYLSGFSFEQSFICVLVCTFKKVRSSCILPCAMC